MHGSRGTLNETKISATGKLDAGEGSQMGVSMQCVTIVISTLVLLLFAPSTTTASDKQQPTIDVYNAAFRHPGNEKAIKALKQILPRVQDYYVVEGDILVTDQELQAYLDRKHGGSSQGDKSAELLVNLNNGQTDYYKDVAARTLTYSVLKSSFPTQQTYEDTVKNFGDAASAWESVCTDCQIHFVYRKELDTNASTDKTNFVVRYFDAGGRFIASSFFPHDGPLRRYVNVDPSYFSSSGFDRIGVFRHELGHVLGYRHEHIRGIAGCWQEGSDWLPLTAYDAHSVMHYFCGGGGSPELRITPIDVAGHKKLYGEASAPAQLVVPPPARVNDKSTLVVRFEGGKVTHDATKVLMYLSERDLVPMGTYSLKSGENPAALYVRKLNLPGSNDELDELIAKLNRDSHGRKRDPRTFQVGETLKYPAVELTTYGFSKTFDTRVPEERDRVQDITKNWDYLIRSAPKRVCPAGVKEKCADSTKSRVGLTGYELRLEVPSTQLRSIVRHINAMQRANVLVTYRSSDQPKPDLYSRVESREYLRIYREQPSIELNKEAYLGDLIGLPPRNEYKCDPATVRFHPDIILIDEPVYHHPSLEGGVANLSGPKIADPVDKLHDLVRTTHANFSKDRDHGTHLAGILVARENGFGVAGLDPEGHVEAWNWVDLGSKVDDFVDHLEKVESKKFPFFVFASKWPKDQLKAIDARVEGAKRLWITAAGQDDSSSSGEDIDERSDAPMRYGLRGYVVVVTACAKCLSLSPQLLSGVNFSKHGLVHVAAPGDLIPSTIAEGSYDAATGTSQATAVVAGLASAMMSCWPSYYSEPNRMKFRLQLTSRPVLNGTDFDKVVAGIVDGRTAILDPTKHWFYKDSGDGGLTGKYLRMSTLSWCTDTLTLMDDNNEETDPVSVTKVRRIVQVGNRWVIYARPTPRNGILNLGEMKKIGPGVLRGPNSNGLLLHTSIGDFTLAQVKDLLLAGPVDVNRSSCQR